MPRPAKFKLILYPEVMVLILPPQTGFRQHFVHPNLIPKCLTVLDNRVLQSILLSLSCYYLLFKKNRQGRRDIFSTEVGREMKEE